MGSGALKPKPELVIPTSEDPSPSRDQAQRELEGGSDDRSLLQRIIAGVGDPIIIADPSARILLLDPLAQQMFGASAAPLPLPIVANQSKLDSYLTAFTFSFLDRQNKNVRFYDPGSRSEMEYAARSTKLYDPEGHLTYTVTVLRDFTGWESAERAQMKRRMLEMEKFAATGKLAGTIAHEINNPMEAIKNAIYLLKDRLDPGSRPIYDALKSEADRVTRIVRQMLGLYRNAAHFGKFDLNTVIEDTLTLFARPLEKTGIRVERNLAPLPQIKGSADQFRQLFSNLVVNAQDSMGHGGRLIIRTRVIKAVREGYGRIEIAVADTGCGIPPEVRDKIFEPFVTTKGEKGTGLGLWIVQGIVENHSGRIQVRSSAQRGTIFRLLFPLAER